MASSRISEERKDRIPDAVIKKLDPMLAAKFWGSPIEGIEIYAMRYSIDQVPDITPEGAAEGKGIIYLDARQEYLEKQLRKLGFENSFDFIGDEDALKEFRESELGKNLEAVGIFKELVTIDHKMAEFVIAKAMAKTQGDIYDAVSVVLGDSEDITDNSKVSGGLQGRKMKGYSRRKPKHPEQPQN